MSLILKTQRKESDYKHWNNHYKERAFCKCLPVGYNIPSISNAILNIDRSYYDPLAIAVFDSSLNILLRRELSIIQKDSAESKYRVAEAAQGKKIFNHCFEFYKSIRLDSAMRSEKKKWKRIKNIDNLISQKIPSW